MNYSVGQVILIAIVFYFFMGVCLVVFAEPIYKWAKNSSMPLFSKGLFARAIVSYYNLRVKGLTADINHWIYCIGFNAGVSIIVASTIIYGYTLAITPPCNIIIAVVFIILFVLFFA